MNEILKPNIYKNCNINVGKTSLTFDVLSKLSIKNLITIYIKYKDDPILFCKDYPQYKSEVFKSEIDDDDFKLDLKVDFKDFLFQLLFVVNLEMKL